MPKDTRWDWNLSVTADVGGLIGHAGAALLRKLADQCGLTAALGAALARWRLSAWRSRSCWAPPA